MSDLSDESLLRRRYQSSLLRAGLAVAAVIPISFWAVPIPRQLSWLSFTQWHTILESFSIVICGLVFGVCWNSFSTERPRSVLILGCASLGSLLLDSIHVLSFEGMPDLITPNTYGKTFLFYFSARVLIASALVTVALSPWKSASGRQWRYPLLLGVLAYVAVIVWAVFVVPDDVPFLNIQSGAVPQSKVLAQSGLVVIFGAAALAFRFRMFKDRNFDVVALFEAAIYMALGEFCFTQVQHLSESTLFLGHIFKALGFIRIYQAIFVYCIRAPYQSLADSQAKLRDNEETLRTVTDNLPALIAYVDSSLVYRFANKNYHRWLNIPEGGIVGKSVREVLGRRHATELVPRMRRALRGESFTYDYQFTARGAQKPTWLNITYMPRTEADGSVQGAYILTLDVTERRAAEDHAAYLASHDELTGLPNRLAFKSALHKLLTPPENIDQKFAILFIDLDRFKTVNDTLGHDAGDKLLKVVANRLRDAVRGADLVARMGGDEMCVLLHEATANEYVSEAASRLREQLKKPVEIAPGVIYRVTVSIGIAMYPGDGASSDSLLKNADIAMYQAKSGGRDQFRFFQVEAEGLARRRLDLEINLQSAIAGNEMILYYQPIFDVISQLPVGIEALIRWKHPTRGLLYPNEFIGVAEEAGFIEALGEWVLDTAAYAMTQLPPVFSRSLFMSVNISARHFQSAALIETVRDTLRRHAIEPSRFHLEMTESALMVDSEEAQDTMRLLKNIGVKLAVDDFGTGYSSLAYLKRFPVDTVKIDRSFVMDLPHDRDDAALAGAIIAMGHSLGLDVIAEGVETKEQLAFLAHHGCNFYQGYLATVPLPLDALIELLTRAPHQMTRFVA